MSQEVMNELVNMSQEIIKLKDQRRELIQELEIQYAWISDIHHEWEGRNTPAGQRKLCRLRALIAKAYGISEQEAQDGVSQRVAEGANT